MNYKQEMVKRLKEDCKVLIEKKIPKALDNTTDDKGVNTYRNLTKALAENIKLIDEYENDTIKVPKGAKITYTLPETTFKDCFHKMCKELNYTPNKYNPNEGIEDEILYKGIGKGELLDGSSFYKEWEDRFLKYIDSNSGRTMQVVIPTNDLTRNIGKSMFLVKQAIENNGIYIAPTKSMAYYMRDIAKGLFARSPRVEYIDKDNDGLIIRSNTKLYIDEGVDLSKIDLDRCEYVIFKQN